LKLLRHSLDRLVFFEQLKKYKIIIYKFNDHNNLLNPQKANLQSHFKCFHTKITYKITNLKLLAKSVEKDIKKPFIKYF